MAQGKPAEALKAYRDGVAIIERLAKSDPGNAQWQRDLVDFYIGLGDVLKAQGNRPDALKAFRTALEIRERLAAADGDHAGGQFDLVTARWRLAQYGEDAAQHWSWIAETLTRLRDEGRLSAVQLKWLPEAKAELAKTRGR